MTQQDERFKVMSDLFADSGFSALAAVLRDEKLVKWLENLIALLRGDTKLYKVLLVADTWCPDLEKPGAGSCDDSEHWRTRHGRCALAQLRLLLGGEAEVERATNEWHAWIVHQLDSQLLFPPVEIRHGGATYLPLEVARQPSSRPGDVTAAPIRLADGTTVYQLPWSEEP